MSHDIPAFVEDGSAYFITLCAAKRGHNEFANDNTWQTVRSSAEYYQATGRFSLRIILAMPDHVHLVASFPRHERMRTVIGAWRRYISLNTGAKWQRDFFDHRLRGHEGLDQKSHYIVLNPVRAGLIQRPSDWPYVWRPASVVAAPM